MHYLYTGLPIPFQTSPHTSQLNILSICEGKDLDREVKLMEFKLQAGISRKFISAKKMKNPYNSLNRQRTLIPLKLFAPVRC